MDVARLVGEDDALVVYHCMSNDSENHATVASAEDSKVFLLCLSSSCILRAISMFSIVWCSWCRHNATGTKTIA